MCKNIFLFSFILILVSCVNTAPEKLKFNGGRTIANVEYTADLQVSDRHYVASVLINVFGEADRAYIENSVLFRPEFGGGCDRFEVSEINNSLEFPKTACHNGLSDNVQASSNPGRYAITMKTCEALINSTNSFNYVMSQIHSNESILAASNISVKKAYSLFYVQETPSADVVRALVELAQNQSPDDGWKRILTVVCISPEWQIH